MRLFLLLLSLCSVACSFAAPKIYQVCVENAWTTQGTGWGGICCLGSLALLPGPEGEPAEQAACSMADPKVEINWEATFYPALPCVYSSKNNNTCPTLQFEDKTDVNLFIVELSASPEKPNTWFGYDYVVWKNHIKGYFYWNVSLLASQ